MLPTLPVGSCGVQDAGGFLLSLNVLAHILARPPVPVVGVQGEDTSGICSDYPSGLEPPPVIGIWCEDPSRLRLMPPVVGISCEYPCGLRHPVWLCLGNLCSRYDDNDAQDAGRIQTAPHCPCLK